MILYETERSSQSEYLYHQDDVNLNFQKHAHYSFEVVFVFDGELLCQVDDKEYRLKSGNILLILPGQIHSYKTPDYCKSYLCVFSNDLVDSFYKEIKGKKLSNPIFKAADYTVITENLKDDGNIFLKKALLYRLCGAAYGQSEITSVEQTNFTLASLIAFYVQNNYTKNISLKQLSREQGYNYSYLSDFFNKTFNQNFSAYVNQFRLQFASHLLETTEKDITEIALESGFSTIRNFNTAFKNAYNVTPREYRKSVLK